METEVIDKLFLELSQVAKAWTAREMAAYQALADVLGVLRKATYRRTFQPSIDRAQKLLDDVGWETGEE